MFHQDAAVVRRALSRHWALPEPVTVTADLPRGVTADVWSVSDGAGRRYVAKLVYDERARVEAGLAVAEEVGRRTSRDTGAPVRTARGALTVPLPTVPGQRHPLALLAHVDGTPAVPGDGLAPDDAARFLVEVHAAAPPVAGPSFADLFDYLEDDRFEIVHPELIRPALVAAASGVRALEGLTWGTCYGDGPEVLAGPDGRLGLVDWGAVMYAPLLWDVACWSEAYADRGERVAFRAAYERAGALPAAELAHVDRLVQLRLAQLLRFLAYRLAHVDHYDETIEADAASLRWTAARLDVDVPSDAAGTP